MSPVPEQRGAEQPPGTNAVPSIVIDIFREGLAEVKDAVREVSANVNQLRGETVSRRDYERFRDELRIDWAAAQQKHDTDIKRLDDEAEKRASEARSHRTQLISVGIGAAVAVVVAVANAILPHLH